MRRDGTDAEPSIEEILASIRRILADMPPAQAHDDAFELPALFRPTQAAAVDPLPPQIGTAIPSGYRIDWETPAHIHDRRTAASLHPSVDSPTTGGAASSPAWAGPPPFPLSRELGAIGPADISRSGFQAPPNLTPPPLPPSPAAPRGRLRPEGLAGEPAAPIEFRAQEPSTGAARPGEAPTEPQVEMRLSSAAQGLVDQAAVALLRPLIKQWLDANIQNVLEKVLEEEIRRTKRDK
jgi:hypothetical protein